MSNLALKLIEGTRKDRDKFINKTDVLEKVKSLSLLVDGKLESKEVANFYEVSPEAIRQILLRHKNEFKDEATTLNASELRQYKKKIIALQDVTLSKKSNRVPTAKAGLTIYNKRGILRMGMLITNSKVAEKVRDYLLNVEEQTAEIQNKQRLKLEKEWTEAHENLALKIAYENAKKDIGIYQSFKEIADKIGTTPYKVQNRWYRRNNKAETSLKEIFDNEVLLLERLNSNNQLRIENKEQINIFIEDIQKLFNNFQSTQNKINENILAELKCLKLSNEKLNKGLGIVWRSTQSLNEQGKEITNHINNITSDINKINKNVLIRDRKSVV